VEQIHKRLRTQYHRVRIWDRGDGKGKTVFSGEGRDVAINSSSRLYGDIKFMMITYRRYILTSLGLLAMVIVYSHVIYLLVS
jgi:hypothetical protein